MAARPHTWYICAYKYVAGNCSFTVEVTTSYVSLERNFSAAELGTRCGQNVYRAEFTKRFSFKRRREKISRSDYRFQCIRVLNPYTAGTTFLNVISEIRNNRQEPNSANKGAPVELRFFPVKTDEPLCIATKTENFDRVPNLIRSPLINLGCHGSSDRVEIFKSQPFWHRKT